MEFYRRCLIQIFGILEEYEVGTEGQRTLLGPLPNSPAKEEEVLKETPAAVSESKDQSAEEQRIQLSSMEEMEVMPPLLTASPGINAQEEVKDGQPVVKEEVEVKEEHQEQAEPRPQQASKYDKLPIKVEEDGEEWEEVDERWAELSRPNGFISGLLHWKAGGGDSTTHIQTGESAPTKERGGREEGRSQEEGKEEVEGGEEKILPAGEDTPPETQEGEEGEEDEEEARIITET